MIFHDSNINKIQLFEFQYRLEFLKGHKMMCVIHSEGLITIKVFEWNFQEDYRPS